MAEKDIRTNLAQNLLSLRGQTGTNESQQELADKLGVRREYVKFWETKERDIKVTDLVKLAEHFNVPTDYLLGLTDEKTTDVNLKAVYRDIGLNSREVKSIRKIKEFGAIDGLHAILDNPAILLLCNHLTKLIRHSQSILDNAGNYKAEAERIRQIQESTPSVTILSPYDEILHYKFLVAQCFDGIISANTGAAKAVRKVLTEELQDGKHTED